MTHPNFRSVMIKPAVSVKETYQIMNDTALMIALVIDDHDKLLGTVTDGDIRRGLLKGLNLESPIESVMNRNSISMPASASRQEILAMMNFHRIAQMPLLDAKGAVVGLELLADLVKRPERISTPVIIFAGGLGKRLYPLTNQTPKPMLPVGGRPLLEFIVMRLADQGFWDFHLSVYYKGEVIRDHFGDGSQWGVSIQYIDEPKPLGTIGAVGLVAGKFKEPVLVLNGDLLTSVNFQHLVKFHQLGGHHLTMAVKNYSYQIPFGVVTLNDGIVVDLQEKPSQKNFISAGMYVVNPQLFSLIPKDVAFDMPDLIRAALAKGNRIAGFPIHEYWSDIGTPREYEQADNQFDEHFS